MAFYLYFKKKNFSHLIFTAAFFILFTAFLLKVLYPGLLVSGVNLVFCLKKLSIVLSIAAVALRIREKKSSKP